MKKIILLIMFLLMVSVVFAGDLSISPTPIAIDREYYLGDSQLSQITVTLQNTNSEYGSISLLKEGTASSFFNISETSLYFNGTQTKSFDVTFHIPQSTSPDLYFGKIKYGVGTNEYIPIYLNVKKRETLTECRLIIPDEYRYSIRRTTKPYTEDFTFKIASACTSGVSIMGIKEDKVYRMESGNQPIRLYGAVSTGEYEAGNTVSFTVEYDVSELAKETYTSNIIISAINELDDSSITKTLKFLITVTGDKPTQYEGNISTITTFPSCSISTTNLVANDTYEIVCTNVVDPNIKIKMYPDLEYLEGIRVVDDEDNKQFKWVFKPKKLGETSLKVSFLLFENPIGPTKEFKFHITSTPVYSGTSMKFVLFGPSGRVDDCGALNGGDTLVIQMRDNSTDNIIANYEIYRDGVKIDGSSFEVIQGRTYSLSATSPNYHSRDYTCTVANQPISIFLSPSEVEINFPFTITTTPANSTLYWDNSEISSPYTPTVTGTHKLKVVKSGFQDTEIDVDVKERLAFLTELPKKIKVNEEVLIEMNRPSKWTVYYGEKNDTISTIFLTTESSLIQFVPDKKGYYKLDVRGDEFVWKTGWNLWTFWKWFFIVVGIIIVVVLGYKIVISKGGEKEEGEGVFDLSKGEESE